MLISGVKFLSLFSLQTHESKVLSFCECEIAKIFSGFPRDSLGAQRFSDERSKEKLLDRALTKKSFEDQATAR